MSRKWCAGWARSDDRRATARRGICAKPPALPSKRRTPTQRSACGKRGEAAGRDGPRKPPGACSCFRQQERARAAVNGLDPVVPHGGVPFAVSRINRAYEDVYGCRDARFSPRCGFPEKAVDQPPRRWFSPRGAGSARAALEFSALRAQRRTPAIRVRKNEVVARHARAAHLESLPATGSARRARGLFTCSTRCRAGAPKSRTARGVLPRACSRAHGVRLNSRLRGQDGLVLEAHLTVRTAKEELLKAVG